MLAGGRVDLEWEEMDVVGSFLLESSLGRVKAWSLLIFGEALPGEGRQLFQRANGRRGEGRLGKPPEVENSFEGSPELEKRPFSS